MGAREPIVSPLEAAVHRRLSELTRSVPGPEAAALAEALLAVLAEHRLDARGDCSVCRGRWSRLLFWRRNRTPCRAYLAARLRLDDGVTQATEIIPAATRHQRRRRPDLHYAS